jgi:phage terminase small subunit
VKKLTLANEKFVAGIVSGMTQRDAYFAAYPRSKKWKAGVVDSTASLLANRPQVKARLDELKSKTIAKVHAKMEVTAERILLERARLAFFDIRKMIGPNGNLLKLHELDDDTAAAIAGMDVETVGDLIVGCKYKLADKNASLTALERTLGVYKDNEGKSAMLNIHLHLGA